MLKKNCSAEWKRMRNGWREKERERKAWGVEAKRDHSQARVVSACQDPNPYLVAIALSFSLLLPPDLDSFLIVSLC